MLNPIVIKRDCIVVEGGYLQTPWVVDVKHEGTGMFYGLHHADRKLARCLGLPCDGRAPFKGTTLFQYLAKLRNAKVDELIITHKLQADPMADKQSLQHAGHVSIKNREKECERVSIPKVVCIALPAFTTSDGSYVAGVSANVFSSHRIDHGVTIELAASSLDWICQAIHASWDCHSGP